MALPQRKVDIVFEHGVQQHTDAKLLPQGWLKSATNRYIEKDGRWRRRFGFSTITFSDSATGSAISEDVQRLTTREDEQIAITPSYLYSRAKTLAKFANRGLVPQCSDLTRKHIKRYADLPARHAAVCDSNGYRMVVWTKTADVGNATSTGEIWAALFDTATGVKVLEERLVSSNGAFPSVVAIGTAFFVFYVDIPGSGTNTLYGRILQTGGSTIAAFDATLYVNTVIAAASCLPYGRPYDVESRGSSIYVWRTHTSGTTVVIEQFDTSLASVANKTHARPATNLGMCVTGNRLWLVAADAANGTYYYTMDLALAGALSPTTVNGTVSAKVIAVIESAADSTKALIYYGDTQAVAAPTPTNDYIKTFQARVTSAGAVTLFGDALFHFWPATKPFRAPNSRLYCVFAFPSKEFNGVYCLMDLRDDILVTAGTSTLPEPDAFFGYGTAGVFEGLFYPHPKAVTGSDAFTCAVGEDLALESYTTSDGVPTTSWLYSVGAAVTYSWRFTTENRRLPVDAQKTLILGGLGMPCQYDGNMVTELGFGYAPDRDYCKVVDSASAGSLTASTGVYQWCFVYEWFDDLGKRHLSQPSVPIQHTMGAAKTSVDIRIQTLTATLRKRYNVGTDCRILIYRTPDAGSVFYLVGSASVFLPANSKTTHSVTYNDGLSDSNLEDNEILYTIGGVQRNGLPGSSACAVNHKGMLFVATGNKVRYSKPLREKIAAEFSPNREFAVGEGDPITAMASLDDSLVIFTERKIFALQYAGVGPDDTGLNPFPEPYLACADVGCVDPRTVCAFRDGLFFQSHRALEILPRGGGAPIPAGLSVEDDLVSYPNVMDVKLVPDAGHVRFLLCDEDFEDGIIEIYDYDNEAWFKWALDTGVGFQTAGIWDDEYVISEVQGAHLLREDATTYQDGGASFFTSVLETGDIRVAGIAGGEHVWETHILGEYLDQSKLELYVSYDSGKTYGGPFAYTLTSAKFTAGQEIALQHDNNQQRTTAMRLKLVDSVYDNPQPEIPAQPNTAGPIWNGVSLLVGVEPGLRPVPVGNRGG